MMILYIEKHGRTGGLLITLAGKEISQLSVKLCWDIKDIKEVVGVTGIRPKVI